MSSVYQDDFEDSFDDDDDDGFNEDELFAEVESRRELALNRQIGLVTHNGVRRENGEVVAASLDENGNQITYQERQQTPISFGDNRHELNEENLQSYLYPTNLEVRDYQFDIVSKSLFKNVLCALPTGLGKTLIASTVMLNFYRWTRNSKIIFMAPTRPLVAQQLKACYGITGIPSHDTAILLDKAKRNRGEIWESKRVFFTTPQVVENDLKTGLVNPKEIVLLVIDEAHRAKGNYAYNNVVKFINRFSKSFRILALTATPASDIDGVQELVDNLSISKVEIRTERSFDTVKYMKRKKIEKITCPLSTEIEELIEMLCIAIKPTLEMANKFQIYEITEPSRINAFAAIEASQKIVRNPTIAEGLKWMYYFLLQLLGVVGQCFRRLNIYGITSFYSYFKEKHTEFTTKWETKKSTNKYSAAFYYHPMVTKLLTRCEEMIEEDKDGLLSHPKFDYMIQELSSFYEEGDKTDSKVIIFTEFRQSALEITTVIENYNINHKSTLKTELKPHIFIGQAREKDRFDEAAFREKAKPKKKGRKTLAQLNVETSKSSIKKKKMIDYRKASRASSSEAAQEQGMNQQQQKELISDFKKGVYNIVVATSIGEEGLDIGEVDLIICFDSTSSPIKNIQRMGRTGRKRDGKVVLLLSSNEENKFDKSMDNYDYIQKQIQTGQMLKYHESDRILPKDIKPVCERKFIEIPEENGELIHAADKDDNDQFLKLATQITTNGRNKKKATTKSKQKAKNDPKQKKLEKRFFMPDNVPTGFQAASALVNRFVAGSKYEFESEGENENQDDSQSKKRSSSPSDADKSYISISELKKRKGPDSEIEKTEPVAETGTVSGVDVATEANNVTVSFIISDDEDELDALLANKTNVSFGVKKNSSDILDMLNLEDESDDFDDELVQIKPRTEKVNNSKTKLSELENHRGHLEHDFGNFKTSAVTINNKRTKLGSTRRCIIREEDNKDKLSAKPCLPQTTSTKPSSIIDQIVNSRKILPDSVVDPQAFKPNDGYLTPNRLQLLYSNYYTSLSVPIGRKFIEPNVKGSVTGGVGHSNKIYRFLETMKHMEPRFLDQDQDQDQHQD
ncbi:hypothetical protein PACTADRAFT_49494 [Pachysolen tannophilus NRRL Y-2460]|uniref:ATP-dependent DNA helicase n=1 Tax=Pachysolen tannophilus NRRL Y-2460 TaxID=669874 RepID=A0A1E4TWM6_PACTA|nr:hypothetical protein PACTADRAFT_49494 [Pachysolen tannophilus NRRL Y-2460]